MVRHVMRVSELLYYDIAVSSGEVVPEFFSESQNVIHEDFRVSWIPNFTSSDTSEFYVAPVQFPIVSATLDICEVCCNIFVY